MKAITTKYHGANPESESMTDKPKRIRNRISKTLSLTATPAEVEMIDAVVAWHKQKLSDPDYEADAITRSSIFVDLFRAEAKRIGLPDQTKSGQ